MSTVEHHPDLIPIAQGAMIAGKYREYIRRRIEDHQIAGALIDGKWYVSRAGCQQLAREIAAQRALLEPATDPAA